MRCRPTYPHIAHSLQRQLRLHQNVTGQPRDSAWVTGLHFASVSRKGLKQRKLWKSFHWIDDHSICSWHMGSTPQGNFTNSESLVKILRSPINKNPETEIQPEDQNWLLPLSLRWQSCLQESQILRAVSSRLICLSRAGNKGVCHWD